MANQRPPRPKSTRPAPKAPLQQLVIASLDPNGSGVAFQEEQYWHVPGALPGETVTVKATQRGKRHVQARLQEVLTPSPERVPVACKHLGPCDGCPLLPLAYPAQLAWKAAGIARTMAQAGVPVTVPPITPSPQQLGYRCSAKLVIAGTWRQPQIGIYRRHSHEICDIGDCRLHHPLINRIVNTLRAGIRKGKVPVWHPQHQQGLLRYLVVRVTANGQQASVVLVTGQRSYNELHHLAKHLQQEVPEVTVVAQNVNPSTGNVILGEQYHFLTRQHVLRETLGETVLELTPGAFFQVNPGAARLLYTQVAEFAALTGTERVVDVYCGIGGIALTLAGKAAEVIGFEVVSQAVADAERNARLNRCRHCRFEAGDAAELLGDLADETGSADVVVLNPPRRGCDREVLSAAARLRPSRLIYVSCDPESLARDLALLAGHGYRPRQLQPLDMFPQTPHVETVVLLTPP